MKVRALTQGDAEACYALFYDSVHNGTAAFYDKAQRDAWAPTRDGAPFDWSIKLTCGVSLCATKWSKIVGFFTLGADGHIDFAYVAPNEMGKGTAGVLYEACEAEARRLGLTILDTEASHLAKRFFEKRGWQVDARQTVIRNGVGIENFRMSKVL